MKMCLEKNEIEISHKSDIAENKSGMVLQSSKVAGLEITIMLPFF